MVDEASPRAQVRHNARTFRGDMTGREGSKIQGPTHWHRGRTECSCRSQGPLQVLWPRWAEDRPGIRHHFPCSGCRASHVGPAGGTARTRWGLWHRAGGLGPEAMDTRSAFLRRDLGCSLGGFQRLVGRRGQSWLRGQSLPSTQTPQWPTEGALVLGAGGRLQSHRHEARATLNLSTTATG